MENFKNYKIWQEKQKLKAEMHCFINKILLATHIILTLSITLLAHKDATELVFLFLTHPTKAIKYFDVFLVAAAYLLKKGMIVFFISAPVWIAYPLFLRRFKDTNKRKETKQWDYKNY